MKECIQLTLPKPTPCFKIAGGTPCITPGCPVKDMMGELKREQLKVDELWIGLLVHSRCRISSLSQDNGEFRERLRNLKS